MTTRSSYTLRPVTLHLAEPNAHDFERILRGLNPERAKIVENDSARFQECHRILQLHIRIKKGETVEIDKEVAKRSLREWTISNARMELIQV